MTIKIYCEECRSTGMNWSSASQLPDCHTCQGKGYREVTLDQLIKPKPILSQAVNLPHEEYIKSCLNLELLK
jgi:excinuclease UvrABC ATPase subunit